MGKNRGNGNREIPQSVEDFASITFTEYKRDRKNYFDSKKELREDYFGTLTYYMSDGVIDWLLKNGHIQQPKIQEMKNKCYEKLAGADAKKFIEYLITSIKDFGMDGMSGFEYLPIILHEIITDIMKYNTAHPDEPLAEAPELFELSEVILKKRLKKAKKKEISDNMAFDLLGVMPCPDAIKYGAFFRVRSVFDLLYKYAEKDPKVNFEKIVKYLFNEDDYDVVIGFALQERKEKIRNFTETQKKLFNDITEWSFNTLEDMSKDEIQDILEKYIKLRKRDASQNKDGNRRYYINSLPDSMYPRIAKVVARIKADDAEAEKYL